MATLIRAPARAWVVGSLAGGLHDETSDVDVVVERVASEDSGVLAARIGSVLGVPVDLLRIEELPASFRDRVLREGIPLDVAR